jgi:hypothetical protein
MTNRYNNLSPRALWHIQNFDEIDLAEICATQEAALERARSLHHPVDYYGTLICASCSAYDGQGTCDNSPCGYEHCPTLAAINRTQESPRP